MKAKRRDRHNKIKKLLEAEAQKARFALAENEGDIGDLKSEWQERDSPSENNLRTVEWSQFSNLQEALAEIEAAKARLEDGVYGLCETCDSEISPKRLAALPAVRNCIACQERIEAESGKEHRASL